MKVLFFGMHCIFSPPVLDAIINAGHEIAAVLTPGSIGAPPLSWIRRPGSRGLSLSPRTGELDTLTAAQQIPLGQLADPRDDGAQRALAALEPDIIVVACFPRLLPPRLLAIAPLGGFNLHPSRLPELRGPAPLFWTLRNGLTESAVTAHRLTDRFDAGDIFAQASFPIPSGVRIDDIESDMARLAGQVATRTLDDIANETLQPIPQRDSESTYAPFPTMHDFIIPVVWSARRAYGFVRGVATYDRRVIVELASGEQIPANDAVNWFRVPPSPVHDPAAANELDIDFVDGVVRIRR